MYKRRTSLEARLCVLSMGLLLAVMLLAGTYAVKQQEASLVGQQRATFETMARAIAQASEPALVSQSATTGERVMQQIRAAKLDFEYVIVRDGSGKSILADSPRLAGAVAGGSALGRTEALATRLSRGSIAENIYRIVVPIRIGERTWGSVAVGFSMANVRRSVDEFRSKILCVFAAAFIIASLFTIGLARGVSSQVKRLTKVAKAVTSGDMNCVAPEGSTDEVGELAHSFNAMIQSLRESQERLIKRANTDSLTDLYNHRYFQERLAAEISRSQRYEHPLSVLMIDIDKFKNFNDRQGHPSGDRALNEIAKVMKGEVRDMDVVARYGGEEFAVILPETDLDEATAAAERIRIAAQRRCFYGKDGETAPLTVSVGVAQYPIHSTEREGLIMAADMALYRAKQSGRNRTCPFEQELRANPAGDPYKVYVLLRATDLGTIEALSSAIDSKHRFAMGHGKKVSTDAVALANAMGLSEEECESVRLASLLRDIGQLGLPDELVGKPEPLSAEDREMLAAHPSLGHAIIQKAPRLKSMLPGILHHHECYDGSGYPFGLKSDDIPLVARIIAVVDAYWAMTADRPHRQKLSPEEAGAELLRQAGTQFDPNVVNKYLELIGGQGQRKMSASAA